MNSTVLFLLHFAGLALITRFFGWGGLITSAALLTIFYAFIDYDWLMNHSKAAPFVALFGRNGARIFYIILGAALFFYGLTQLGIN